MSKAEIIGAIRRGLGRGALPPDQQAMLEGRIALHPRHLIPARAQLDLPGRIELFTFYLEREFGSVERLESLADVPRAVSLYLASQNLAQALTVSPHAALQRISFDKVPMLDVRYGVTSPTDEVCLTHGFAGIAETGTLMLPSGPERPTRNNLLPDHALVVLQASQIVASYEDAFDLLLKQPDADVAGKPASSSARLDYARPDSDVAGKPASSSGRLDYARPDSDVAGKPASSSGRDVSLMPRNVMLVTGPSRSADIEQTLELGAHGPRRLHVMIIDGEA